MKRNFLTSAALLAAITTAMTFAAGSARAGLVDPVLEISVMSGGVTYTAFGASPLVFVQSVGGFTTTVNTGTSTNTPSIDLSSVEISSSDAGTIVVTLSASGFTSPNGAANWLSQLSGNIVFGSATVTMQSYIDDTNTLLGTDIALSTLTGSTTPFAASGIAAASATDPFALTEVLTITTTGPSLLSFDASIVNAPEPASLTLLGFGIAGLATLGRRKRTA